jgi:hypothetical protein
MIDGEARDAADPTAFRMQEAYRWVRAAVADLTEEQLRWQPGPTAPSIRFHLFHVARWADNLQRLIGGADDEVWHADRISARWRLDPARLGYGESGAMMDDADAMALELPDRAALLAYCDRVLGMADGVLAAVGEDDMRRVVGDAEGRSLTLGAAIADQLSHTARHLGMIECLRGVQGLRGTVTV